MPYDEEKIRRVLALSEKFPTASFHTLILISDMLDKDNLQRVSTKPAVPPAQPLQDPSDQRKQRTERKRQKRRHQREEARDRAGRGAAELSGPAYVHEASEPQQVQVCRPERMGMKKPEQGEIRKTQQPQTFEQRLDNLQEAIRHSYAGVNTRSRPALEAEGKENVKPFSIAGRSDCSDCENEQHATSTGKQSVLDDISSTPLNQEAVAAEVKVNWPRHRCLMGMTAAGPAVAPTFDQVKSEDGYPGLPSHLQTMPEGLQKAVKQVWLNEHANGKLSKPHGLWSGAATGPTTPPCEVYVVMHTIYERDKPGFDDPLTKTSPKGVFTTAWGAAVKALEVLKKWHPKTEFRVMIDDEDWQTAHCDCCVKWPGRPHASIYEEQLLKAGWLDLPRWTEHVEDPEYEESTLGRWHQVTPTQKRYCEPLWHGVEVKKLSLQT